MDFGFLASWSSALRGEVLTSREGAAEIQRVEDEAIIDRLTAVRGIGKSKHAVTAASYGTRARLAAAIPVQKSHR